MSLNPHQFSLRIYWEDTDAGGVVFYVNYLKYFERARTEWLRELGFSQEAWRQQGMAFVVAATQLSYLQPARLDDELQIETQIHEAGRASLVLTQQARRDAQVLIKGQIRIGFVDIGTFRPRRIPNELLDLIA